MIQLTDHLKATTYPGRGIVVGHHCVYYFIMGRSANSRNRIFVPTDDGIRTEAFDPGKMEDPSLIIYHPVRALGQSLIVTNGDQTDTIHQYGHFQEALMTRCYEPDGPNWTPRISALIQPDGSFELAILKRVNGRCQRSFFAYEGCDEGEGYFLSTYAEDGSPLPSFVGEPMHVAMSAPEAIWEALHPEHKVSLYANIEGQVRLFNKNLGD